MKKAFLSLISILLFNFSLHAQCPDCTPDTSCIGDEGPISCPEFLPDGTANEYYEEVITFYMPTTFTDPGTGFEVTLEEVTIGDIVGVPFGIEVTFDNEDLVYYPSEGNEHGCATVCGTPLLPGYYEALINITALAVVLGLEVEVNESFVLSVNVLPGDGANTSFSYNSLTGCDSLEVNFAASINGDPQPTSWDWNFGNGNTSDEEFPPSQTYNEVGEYTVSLTTQLSNLVLNEVDLDDLSSGWSGDVEELIEGLTNPDPYFVLENGDGTSVYVSTAEDNTTSYTWVNLNIILNNGPYTISFYDEDNISEDDFLGSYVLPGNDGSSSFNVNGGTEGTVDINLVVDSEFYNEELVQVFPSPEAIINYNEDNQSLSFDDPSLVNFIWFYNNESLTGENDSILFLEEWGVYSCHVYSEEGCSAISEDFLYCPDFTPSVNSQSGLLTAPEGFESYQWYLNGEELVGEDSFELELTEYGNYTVQITTDYGCDVESMAFQYVGIEDLNFADHISLFPNPGSTDVQLTCDIPNQMLVVTLYDLNGRQIKSMNWNSTDRLLLNNENDLETGTYLVDIRGRSGYAFTEKLIILP